MKTIRMRVSMPIAFLCLHSILCYSAYERLTGSFIFGLSETIICIPLSLWLSKLDDITYNYDYYTCIHYTVWAVFGAIWWFIIGYYIDKFRDA